MRPFGLTAIPSTSPKFRRGCKKLKLVSKGISGTVGGAGCCDVERLKPF
jgi:hypothetical protein